LLKKSKKNLYESIKKEIFLIILNFFIKKKKIYRQTLQKFNDDKLIYYKRKIAISTKISTTAKDPKRLSLVKFDQVFFCSSISIGIPSPVLPSF